MKDYYQGFVIAMKLTAVTVAYVLVASVYYPLAGIAEFRRRR